MKPRFDVLGLGCTAVDELLFVERYPAADGKAEISGRERQCGGLCATALVAAARFGARCAYAGTLGEDEDSRFVMRTLRGERVNTSHVIRSPVAGPVRSVIVVDEHRSTRTIFYDPRRAVGADSSGPSSRIILSTRVLLVDRFGISGMIRAARLARSHQIPVVADFESSRGSGFSQLLNLADHLILSERFSKELTGARDSMGAATRLWRDDRSAVVVTCGDRGGWYYTGPPGPPRRFFSYRVGVVDTTGCGDVFHGVYAAALAEGCDLEQRLRFASAAAAMKATQSGGQKGIPARGALVQFLKMRRARR